MARPTNISGLYVNTFGSPNRQPVIFIHGGPGHNSQNFELSTAKILANRGYYVVVYDQRGQGRSALASRKSYTYKTYSNDLLRLIQTLKLKEPILIGHSHGTPIAVRFDEQHPGQAKAIILLSGTLDDHRAIDDIYSNCARDYGKAKSRRAKQYFHRLTTIYNEIKTCARGSKPIAKSVAQFYGLAELGCRIYDPPRWTAKAKRLLRRVSRSRSAPRDQRSTLAFLRNENNACGKQYDQVRNNKGRYFGIYGDQDGIFTAKTLNEIATAVNDEKSKRFFLIRDASHSVYVDRQDEFLDAVDQVVSVVNEPASSPAAVVAEDLPSAVTANAAH